MNGKGEFAKDEKLKSMYSEKVKLQKLIFKIDFDIQEYIKKTYPAIAKEIGDKIKRVNLYRDGFKKKRRY
ncbi:MAG TPA: hypothetical protein ENI73_08060 [Spirochaetes bacterium]|nr:hypothetical protein [Spirochaetota bacterium]